MKFIVSSSILSKQLGQINGVINSNTVLPILEDFLFEITDKKLSVTATDLETVMKVQLEVESKADGKVCIPHKVLSDYLKNIPDQPLTFNIDKNFGIDITSDNGKYKIMGENPDNFPKEPGGDETGSFTMASTALVTAINKTLFAVSTDDLRPAMTGVFFEVSKKAIQFVSTDAHKLVKYARADVKASQSAEFIMPKKPLTILKGILATSDAEVTVEYNDSIATYPFENYIITCR